MTEPIKINSLEIENVKRIQAVKIDLTGEALTIVGGNNAQGKTSVLDAITWALGGGRKAPSNAKREGSAGNPNIKLTLSNGIIVERKGKNSTLKVTDPSGHKSGQSLLDSFISELALDLPKFMGASDKEKAKILLQIIGVGDQLKTLDQEEEVLESERLLKGREALSKDKYAAELPYFEEIEHDEPVSAQELIDEQQAILARNGENLLKRQKVGELKQNVERIRNDFDIQQANIERLQRDLEEAIQRKEEIAKAGANADVDLTTAEKTAETLEDESTAELAQKLTDIDEINDKIRSNQTKEYASGEAKRLKEEYKTFDEQIKEVRDKRLKLLDSADLPLPELSVSNGKLTYKGQHWDGMSGAEQLKVATAIVRKLKPECGFVLLDKLEQMDLPMLEAFGHWLEGENLQVIATRVSTGDECSIIIEDGKVADSQTIKTQTKQDWGI